MAAERTSGIDFSGLEETFEWLKARKNLFVGVALVAVLAWAATEFVQTQQADAAQAPWRAALAGGAEPWNATPDELAASLADPAVKGTPAEPYLAWWHALRVHEAGDAARALELLAAFQRDFASHPFAQAKLPGSGEPLVSAVTRMEAQIRAHEQWKAQHPLPTANPLPTGRRVTLVTPRGNIVIGLHEQGAPRSVEAFLAVAPALKEQYIAKTAPDKWIELGLSAAGTPIETTAVTGDFPPFEQNGFSHFAGSVAFRQPPFTKGPWQPDLRVTLVADANEDGRSTIFGEVVEGFDLLLELSKEPRKSDNPQLLEAPVQITEVQIGEAPAAGS